MERWNYIAIGGYTGRKLCITGLLLEIFILWPSQMEFSDEFAL